MIILLNRNSCAVFLWYETALLFCGYRTFLARGQSLKAQKLWNLEIAFLLEIVLRLGLFPGLVGTDFLRNISAVRHLLIRTGYFGKGLAMFSVERNICHSYSISIL